jgi:hypothetical protein
MPRKSSLALVEAIAIAMASGRNLLLTSVPEPLRVWYWNGEDPREEIERRIAAIGLHYRIRREEIEGRLFVDSGRDSKIIIAAKTTNGVVIAKPLVDALRQTLRDNKIDVLQIDPLISSHRVEENDNTPMEIVLDEWAGIAETENIAMEIIHHSRKTGGTEVTVEHGRGASAIINKVRSARTLNTMTKDEAKKAGVTAQYRSYFRMDNGKANLAPPPDKSEWFRLQSVPLGNGDPVDPSGDEVGVVTTWEWPGAFDGITTADLLAAQKKVASGGSWRANSQAKDWVGYAIAEALRLDATLEADKHKITRMLKIWIDNGAFAIELRKDDERHEREFVVVGKWATD